MKLIEAINLLRKNNYIVESNDFNDYDAIIYKDKADAVKSKYNDKISSLSYTNNGEYNDVSGTKWRYVTNTDYNTIALAVIDGMCDMGRLPSDLYKNIKSKKDLDKITMDMPIARRMINQVYQYLYPYINNEICKVYRGFNIPVNQLKTIDKTELLKTLSNVNKEFNSYTLDPNVAESFALGNALGQRRKKEDTYAIMIEGEADTDNISFAYTAYLVGKHGNLSESEININCLKELKNQKIVSIRKIKYVNGQYIES